MSLFDTLGSTPGNTPMNPLAMVQQLKQNPAMLLRNAGYNVPANITNPQQIVNHLLQTGQISNGRLAQAQQMMRMMK